MTDYTIKHADGTGRLQRGYYAHNESPDCMAEEDRWIGPWRTERGVRAALAKAELAGGTDADADDELCRLAQEAAPTPAMSRERDLHSRVRGYMS